ncbi:MAG: oligosaccharide flippase family protein [Pirellulales bacterium]|nr:oligosaccharide flippase family protein [Pirellulales bacterium]
MTHGSSTSSSTPEPDANQGKKPEEESSSPAKHPSLSSSLFKLSSGRVATTAIAAATGPIVARLYDPNCFGILELAVAFTVLFYAGSRGFGYGLAMPLATSKAEFRAVFVLALLLGGTVSTLVGVAAVFAGEAITDYWGHPEFAKYVIVAPLLCIGVTIRNLLDLVLSCERQFGIVAVRGMIETIGRRVVQIGLGFTALGNTATGLLSGLVFGVGAAALAFSVKPLKAVLHVDGEPFRFADLKTVAIRYRNFPLFRFWTEFLNAVTYSLPIVLLGSLFSVKVVGYYGVGRPLLYLPLVLFAQTSRNVFYIEVSKATAHGHSAAPVTMQLLRLLVTLVAFPFMVVLLLGAFLFEYVYGPDWREAGIYAQLLLPGIAVMAIGLPVSAMFEAKNRMGEGLLLNIALVVVQCLAMFSGAMLCDPNSTLAPRVALAFLSAGTALIWMYVSARSIKIAQASRRQTVRILIPPCLEAFLLLLPAAISYWIMGSPIATLVALTAACVIYPVLLHRRHPGISRKVKALLKRRGRPEPSDIIEVE